MRFFTRAFLLSFIPFVSLLLVSFWAIQTRVESAVRNELRSSLRENHLSIARIRAKSEFQNSRFLKIVGENASLKAGLQLLLSERESVQARLTVEDQLRELCARMGFDFLLVADSAAKPLAGIVREGKQWVSVDRTRMRPTHEGLLVMGEGAYQIASVPIDQGDENIGLLSVGERFDFSEFSTPAVLIHNGRVLKSSISGVAVPEVETALAACQNRDECDVRLRGETYVSLPMQSVSLGDGYVVRSLQNVDSASASVQAALGSVFLIASIGAGLAALLCSLASSRSIVRPIAAVVSRLRRSERTGLLPEFDAKMSPIREICELTQSFNRAAAANRESRESLLRANFEFVESLASALDARDPYTAGHSHRVSKLSCAVALEMGVVGNDLDEIRVGALLHDIGKIGIADDILQKPGKLTHEEFEIVKQHPSIGRRILEGVSAFAGYLPAVELHHENWDGSGYPRGLQREITPLCARIIHVSDAYDAMTSDRPYRLGMRHERAIHALRTNAGTQFDPRIVEAFVKIGVSAPTAGDDSQSGESAETVLNRLAQALDRHAAPVLTQGRQS